MSIVVVPKNKTETGSFFGFQPRKLSYSRHEISDGDTSTAGINYKVHMQVRRMMSEGRIRHRRNKHSAPNGTAKEVPILPATITHGKRVTGSAKVLQDDNIRHQLKESRSNAEMTNSDEEEYISFSTKRPFKPGDMEDYSVHGSWMLRKQSK